MIQVVCQPASTRSIGLNTASPRQKATKSGALIHRGTKNQFKTLVLANLLQEQNKNHQQQEVTHAPLSMFQERLMFLVLDVEVQPGVIAHILSLNAKEQDDAQLPAEVQTGVSALRSWVMASF